MCSAIRHISIVQGAARHTRYREKRPPSERCREFLGAERPGRAARKPKGFLKALLTRALTQTHVPWRKRKRY